MTAYMLRTYSYTQTQVLESFKTFQKIKLLCGESGGGRRLPAFPWMRRCCRHARTYIQLLLLLLLLPPLQESLSAWRARANARSVCRLMHHNIVITTPSYVVKPSVVSHADMTAPSHGEHLVGRVAVSASLPRSHPGRTHNPSCRPALGGPSHDPRVFIPRSCQGIFWGRTTHGCQPPPPFFSRPLGSKCAQFRKCVKFEAALAVM